MEADDHFSDNDDDSLFSLTLVKNSKLQEIRKGWNNIAMILGTDETVIFDTENKSNNLDLKENEEVLHDDDGEDGKFSKRNVNFSQTPS